MTITQTRLNWPIASFLARWIVGLLFFMAGFWKVFELGVEVHAQKFFIEGFADHWIPEWLLWGLGLSIPFIELIGGFLLCLGWRLRETLATLGMLLIVTTYGHALQTPLFDIDGHTFTRLALILFVLMVGWDKDKTTLAYWLKKSD